MKRGGVLVLGAPERGIEGKNEVGEGGGGGLPRYEEVLGLVDLEALGGRVDDDDDLDDDVEGEVDHEEGGGGQGRERRDEDGGDGKGSEKEKNRRGEKEVLAQRERERESNRATEVPQLEADQEMLPEYSKYDRQG